MKKILFVLLFVISQQIFATETIKVVAGESFAPLMWNDKGIPRGIAIEVAKAVVEKAGYNFVIETCPWLRCQLLAENEGAFITGFSSNEERLKKFFYTEPIIFSEVVIVTKKGKEFPFKNDEDLKGKRIGYQNGSGFGPRFENLKKIFKTDFDHNDIARVKKIDADRIEGGIFSLGLPGFAYAAKQAGFKVEDFTILPEMVAKDPNFMATGIKTPNAKEKIAKINAALKALIEDGTIARILQTTY